MTQLDISEPRPKLSDAMEAGWQGLGKAIGEFQHWYFSESELRARVSECCALGAACYAVAPDKEVDSWLDVAELFPQIREVYQESAPLYGLVQARYGKGSEVTIGEALMVINDETDLAPDQIVELVRNMGY